jgi:hypothetical protein
MLSFYLICLIIPIFSFCQSLQKIPIEASRWYQLNNSGDELDQLFDGELKSEIQVGYGKLVKYHYSYYPLLPGELIDIKSLRMYDWKGVNKIPTILYVIDKQWKRIPIARFLGEKYDSWVGPDPAKPNQFQLSVSTANAQYLMIQSGDVLPTEIELFGKYNRPNSIKPLVRKPIPLKNYFGINGYEWNFENAAENSLVIDEKKFQLIKGFSGFRHYLDWKKLEETPGNYTFNPTADGGWNYDAIYEKCKREGISVLACIKTLPEWLLKTYPVHLRNNENVPAKYGANLSEPSAYLEQAKLGFQFVARYGSNKQVDPALISVNKRPRWNNDPVNSIKIGMGLIQYIECENERDKWWKGRQAYQTAREYAANPSAFYDGHKNTMGKGVGVKNADKNIKVVMGGLALANTDYLKGMIDWCKEFRGFKKDGSIDVCWDIINYHLYTNDQEKKRGIAPEKNATGVNAAKTASAFIKVAHEYLNDMPVWVTEAGYDLNQASPNKAIPIGIKSNLETQADWLLRTSLLYARVGIQKVFYYQLEDDSPGSSALYGTSGLIGNNGKPRPAANYFFQVNQLFGNYQFYKSLSLDPVIDQYLNEKGHSMYVLYIPEERAATGSFLLDLHKSTSAIIYSPNPNAREMKTKIHSTNNGKLLVEISETPLFVVGN